MNRFTCFLATIVAIATMSLSVRAEVSGLPDPDKAGAPTSAPAVTSPPVLECSAVNACVKDELDALRQRAGADEKDIAALKTKCESACVATPAPKPTTKPTPIKAFVCDGAPVKKGKRMCDCPTGQVPVVTEWNLWVPVRGQCAAGPTKDASADDHTLSQPVEGAERSPNVPLPTDIPGYGLSETQRRQKAVEDALKTLCPGYPEVPAEVACLHQPFALKLKSFGMTRPQSTGPEAGVLAMARLSAPIRKGSTTLAYVEGGAGVAGGRPNAGTLVPVAVGVGLSFALDDSASWRFELGLQGLQNFHGGAVSNRPGDGSLVGGEVGPHVGLETTIAKGLTLGIGLDVGYGNANHVDDNGVAHTTKGPVVGGSLEMAYHLDW